MGTAHNPHSKELSLAALTAVVGDRKVDAFPDGILGSTTFQVELRT
jgi:hypothetical protein